MSVNLPERFIAILAPYPGQDRFMDGWMSRIRTIDLALAHYTRVYIDFQEWFPESSAPEVVLSSTAVIALRMNPRSREHKELADEILTTARFVYVHTMHQCEYALDYIGLENLVVDIHGIVPEEELMMGSVERSEKYSQIELEVFRQLKTALVVTKAMARHFSYKYPSKHAELIHLPVYDFDAARGAKMRLDELYRDRRKNQRDRTIYAGGAQVWQCVHEMLGLIRANCEVNDFSIFSHDEALFARLIKDHGLPPSLFKGYVDKERLQNVYRTSNFGFVLRKDTTVNRVASPTKICDYCSAAVIPIVEFSGIGDFEEYGYSYVKSTDFAEGYIPDLKTQYWMAESNFRCIEQMEVEFQSGINALLKKIENYMAS
jgi:hypothetical protein